MGYNYNTNYNRGNQIAKRNVADVSSINALASNPGIIKRFEESLGSEANAKRYIRSIVSACSTNVELRRCDPNSIFASAMIAATLDLEINPNLGFAYLIPYGGKCQFQMGYKGFIQLALRTGQYKMINCGVIYADEYEGYNPITGKLGFKYVSDGMRDSGEGDIVGYFCYIELVSGFQKLEYWTKQRCIAHRKRFSKAKSSPWDTDFDAMAIKTVIKYTLSHFGVLSTELQKAIEEDQIVMDTDGNGNYLDNPTNESESENGTSNASDAEIVEEVPPAKEVAPVASYDDIPDDVYDELNGLSDMQEF